jgi:hypothetical protein
MVMLLLFATFVIAFAVASVVVAIFARPVDRILKQIVADDLSAAWARYLRFAIYVMGIGGGVRVWDLEKYLTQQNPYPSIVALTAERWLLEIYQTVIGTLQSTAAVLLVFFVFALVAVVVARLIDNRQAERRSTMHGEEAVRQALRH